MIKETEISVNINSRNIGYYTKLGYNFVINSVVNIEPMKLPICAKNRVTAICEICYSENSIQLNKYYVNKNRNNKNYYSCFKCKNIEKEKTCLQKYGVKSFSQTDKFKQIESNKWKGIQKGSEKGKKTMMEKYGVDSYFKTKESKNNNKIWMSSEEFKEKSKKTMLKKYGVDSYSKTSDFKKHIMDNKEIIVKKIKQTFLLKYGVDWISKTAIHKNNYQQNLIKIREKIKNTCIEKYGVENVSQVKEIYDKILYTKLKKGIIIDDELLNRWELYKKKCRTLTNKLKKKIYEDWDGYDYYDNEFIKGNISLSHTHKFYPTIDHKISLFYGFSNEIPEEEICHIENLCITKRSINSSKNNLTEDAFKAKKK
jgi:hypothetical protein